MAASSFADRPVLSHADVDGSNDPFVSPAPKHHRFSHFDNQLFSLGPASSPGQAKRALEAHLAETERRMAEVGKLGTALVDQQKKLADRLKDVEELQAEGELNPELRSKLSEIEKEYNDVARETARAFLPKQRVPSNEVPGSPYVPDGRSGRRSVSPSKFESQATGSPTKLNIPNRKLRNQPANRVHDIEFAAEISTSLLAQVRNLQSLLAEKDEELRDTQSDRANLEIEAENFQQRLKTLDESEHRYKDENWNLETQIHELIASQKDSADREKKLAQSLNVLQAEKNQAQKELDEVKVSHSKLAEEHEATVKHHDIELGTAKRNVVLAETEKAALSRKIEDLMSQNQELARAVSSQRGRTLERDSNRGMSESDLETATENGTPEHSPPPSPIKGTPRHPVLESETLRTSLLHAQRTIQSQRSQLHREKTEKLELKRLLQDSRDELEKTRSDSGSISSRRSRKIETKEFRKPAKSLLGGQRSSRSEVVSVMEDPDWEEQDDNITPRHSPTHTPSSAMSGPGAYPMTTDNETSDAAFETANERGTETEDFQTGAEEFSGDDDDDDDVETETESPSKRTLRGRPASLNLSNRAHSFHSTASTSADEDEDDDFAELKTPVAQSHSRLRLRSRGFLHRRSRQASEEPPLPSSPISHATSSATGTPQTGGQSLFAELAELDSDDESLNATPSRSVRSMTPASVARSHLSYTSSVPPLPKLAMVDSGIMTDPVKKNPSPPSSLIAFKSIMVDCGVMTDPFDMNTSGQPAQPAYTDVATAAALAPDHLLVQGDTWPDGTRSRPQSMWSYSDAGAQYDPDLADKLAQFPMPPSVPKIMDVEPLALVLSDIEGQTIEPVEEPKEEMAPPPVLAFTAVDSQYLDPIAEPEAPPPPPPVLVLSSVATEVVEPKAEPEVIPPVPVLAYSPLVSELVEPKAEPEVVLPIPLLSLTPVVSEIVEPKAEPEVVILPPPTPKLALSSTVSQTVEPLAEPEVPALLLPALSVSPLFSHNLEPWAQPEVKAPAPNLSFASVASEVVEPVSEPEPEPRMPAIPTLTITSDIRSEHVEPLAEPELVPAPLCLSGVQSWNIEPRADPEPVPSRLSIATFEACDIEPIVGPEEPTIPLVLSDVRSLGIAPRVGPEPAPISLAISGIQAWNIEPRADPEPVPTPLGISGVQSWDIEPRADPAPPAAPPLTLSSVKSEGLEPVSPPTPIAPVSHFALSPLNTVETEPFAPRSPKRDAIFIPRAMEASLANELPPRTPDNTTFASSIARRAKGKDASDLVIAEDETRQSPSDARFHESPESQKPFKEISTNSDARARAHRKPSASMLDQSAQTSLTANAIEEMMAAKTRGHERALSAGSSVGSPGTVRIRRFSQGQESFDTSRQMSVEPEAEAEATALKRPRSASSSRPPIQPLPPLPSNHKEAIAAARSGSAHSNHGTTTIMGPPLWPASAMRANRPRTPSRPQSPASVIKQTPTPRASAKAGAGASGSGTGRTTVHSPTRGSARSRASSVSSFVSEVDARFNMQSNGLVDANGFGPNTDPRMIQAITQTMIGEYLWKYTRKAGRGEMSENRHRRYFWVHPYTRTLYWSDRDPSTAGRAETKAKSVPIEAVRVVTDDNPNPPGLHRKSLIVISPGRAVKFTCTTGARHETWFNALSYLLLRTNEEGQNDTEEMAGHITQADVDEFNPQIGGGRTTPPTTTTTRPKAPPSLSSYNSRTTRNQSPTVEMTMNVPRLTPTPHKTASTNSVPQRPSIGTLSRISGYWKTSTFGSLRSRTTSGYNTTHGIYEASEVHDSAEDVREMIERQDREADRLENVRACCDGKHDVGTLHKHHHHSKRGRLSPSPAQSHAGPSATTPMGSMRSRT